MEVEKEIIIEFNKMLLDHSETLQKISGGLAVVNLLLIANLRHVHPPRSHISEASMLVALSAISCGISFVFGYLANSAIIASMSDYATTGKWEASGIAEWFTLGQILGLAVAVAVFLFVVVAFRRIALDALMHVGLGGGK